MKYRYTLKYILFAGFMLVAPFSVTADILILIHGYSSDESEWYESGITRSMQAASWGDAGTLFYAANTVTGETVAAGIGCIYKVSRM